MSVSSGKSEVVKQLLMISDRSILRSFCVVIPDQRQSRCRSRPRSRPSAASRPSHFQRAGEAESYEDVLFPFFRSHGFVHPAGEKFHPAFPPLNCIVSDKEKKSHRMRRKSFRVEAKRLRRRPLSLPPPSMGEVAPQATEGALAKAAPTVFTVLSIASQLFDYFPSAPFHRKRPPSPLKRRC